MSYAELDHFCIEIVTDHIRKTLSAKSTKHQKELQRLEQFAEDAPLTTNVIGLEDRPQFRGVNTTILDPHVSREDFIFSFDRIVAMLIEKCIYPARCVWTWVSDKI